MSSARRPRDLESQNSSGFPRALLVNLDPALSASIVRLTSRWRLTARVCTIEAAGSSQGVAIIVAGVTSECGGKKVIRDLRLQNPSVPLLVVAYHSTEDLAVEALRAGARDYLKAPLRSEDIEEALGRCLGVSQGAAGDDDHGGLVGAAGTMADLRSYAVKVASSDSNVLITGETGTGKELVARLIHEKSQRSDKPMVCVNCAAIPESLLESELFGFERGAFTGAYAGHLGQLEMASGGSIFFDEIGEMSPYAQAKVLRVIEDKSIHRLGGRARIPLDVRVIAATNRDLDKDDQFRRDLYFRLNVGRIHLSPLRERRSDIPALANHFIAQFNRSFRVGVRGVSEGVMEQLVNYSWPGNVRELKNVIESVFVSGPGTKIEVQDLPAWFRALDPSSGSVEASESERLLSALRETNWNKSKVAIKLHWSRMTVYRKMAKYHLNATPHASEL